MIRTSPRSAWYGATVLLLSLVASPPAAAIDGTIEINQAIALAGGINGDLVADPAGFPVRITQTGSYRLTGNLVVPNLTTRGIEIIGEHVTVDFNGFSLSGPNTCSGVPVTTCTANNTSAQGVLSAAVDTTIRNGTVSGMGSSGVHVSSGGRIEEMKVFMNGRHGIQVSGHSIVTGCVVMSNGREGIASINVAGQLDIISGNIVTGNGGIGIAADSSVVSGNTVSRSGEVGILNNLGTTSGNVVQRNVGLGLVTFGGAFIQNVVIDNNSGGDQTNGGTGFSGNICGTDSICP